MVLNGVSSWFSPLMMKMTETVSSLSDERIIAVKDVLVWLLAYHAAFFEFKRTVSPARGDIVADKRYLKGFI